MDLAPEEGVSKRGVFGGGRPAGKSEQGEKTLMPVMANEPIILNVYDMVSRKVKNSCFKTCLGTVSVVSWFSQTPL